MSACVSSTSFQPHVEGTDDKQDWQEVMEAMNIMNMSETEQFDIIRETLNLFLTSFKIFLM